ncbi:MULTISPECIES: SIS domain-containing protein [unclassified Janibacter]|uniref:SIS domain-containing protein n=1 Tax=unclassified Janibacter TaxID=2649294 RepID=UPI003D022B9C
MVAQIDDEFLEDPEAIGARDTQGTLRALATAGAQVRSSGERAGEAGIERVNRGDRPRAVLVAALGGASAVADVLQFLAEPGSPIAVTSRGNLPLPGWVGPLDLVIAVSQSGKAHGPVGLAREAARRGAGLLTIGAADSPLAEACADARGVHVPFDGMRISSRTALWSMLTPALLAGSHLGLFTLPPGTFAAVADLLDDRAGEYRPSSESFVNPAKSLAHDLAGTVPVVLGDGPLTGVAARRAAAMLTRTARVPAVAGELPDAASPVVACFDGPLVRGGGTAPGGGHDLFADPFIDGPTGPRLGLLALRDVLPDPITREAAAAHDLAQAVVDSAHDAGAKVAEVSAETGHPLERLAGLMALTDFAATYLALGTGLDPGRSAHVADLRDRTS